MEFERLTVSADELLIDPNNPRYFDLRDHQPVNVDRYVEEQIQVEAISKLAPDVRDLRRSILANGFMQFESIVVKDYPHAEGKYLVVEGNRRVVAILGIRRDFHRGILPERYHAVAASLDALDVLLFQGTEAEEKIIQGIRHVAGPREWKTYQQALLVKELRDSMDIEFEEIQDSLGLGPTIVRRVYNTLKAFEQMQDDDEYGDLADRGLFSLFQEMLRSPVIRGWLDWSDTSLEFRNSANRKNMYRVIVGEPMAEDGANPTISNPPDMRIFGRILGHERKERVLERLIEGELSVAQAWAILEPGLTPWQQSVATVAEALERLPADELQSLTEEMEAQLRRLAEVLERKLEQATRLRRS